MQDHVSHKKDTKSTLAGPINGTSDAMTSDAFWAELKKHGYTKRDIINAGGRRRVILQSRDTIDFNSITHPDDLTEDQRKSELSKFIRIYVG